MNSFDFVITIAMGSTFSAGLLQKSIPLAETLSALGFLILAQFILTYFKARSRKVAFLITNEPKLLYFNGDFIDSAMKKARVTQDEIRAAAREHGNTLEEIEAVVLETNGKLSAVSKTGGSHEFQLH